jgi:hypothetical protein
LPFLKGVNIAKSVIFNVDPPQDASLFDDANARHYSTSSQVHLRVSDGLDDLDETVSLDPAGDSRLNSFSASPDQVPILPKVTNIVYKYL